VLARRARSPRRSRRPRARGRAREHDARRQVLRVGAARRPVPHRDRPKDIAKGQVVLARRVLGEGEERKQFLPEADVLASIGRGSRTTTPSSSSARARGARRTRTAASRLRALPRDRRRAGRGFVYTGWCGSRGVRVAGEGGREGDDPRAPDPEFRSAEAPHHVRPQLLRRLVFRRLLRLIPTPALV
jgi:hypothetical protein